MSSLEKLKSLRSDAGVSQNALASAIGKSHTYVWSVEAGRERLTAKDTIVAWADALGVHPDVVYKAVGQLPHDLLQSLQEVDADMWDAVRALIHHQAFRG